MKTLQRRIQQAAKDARVSQPVVERDYAESYVLLGIASHKALRKSLVFKGGTALRKIYFARYRYSEDLDFSSAAGPTDADLLNAVRAAVDAGQAAARALAPVTMTVERYKARDPHPAGQEAFLVRVQFPWQRQPMIPVKIEVTQDEPVLLPAPERPVVHGYDEPFDVCVRTYALEEICAEKLRATRQTQARLAERGWVRSRARDYYDLWHLVRLDRVDWREVSAILPRKCAHRDLRIDSAADVFGSALLDEVRATWERTLGPFVTDLPDVNRILNETRSGLETLLRL